MTKTSTRGEAVKKDVSSDAAVVEKLRDAGLRPTRQRMALARLLFDKGDRHVTAESLHGAARAMDIQVSLATIYNNLNQFTEAGLLREVVVDAGKSYFDTNMSPHHHFYHESAGTLTDIPKESVTLAELPDAPEGTKVAAVDVIIRLSDA